MKKLQRGFTIIELLFVVAIIAVLVALGLSAYKQRAINAKVDKASLQVQQLLQAGSAYYIDNACWPGSPACGANPPSFNNYIPINTLTDPWGHAYTYAAVDNNKRFQVTVHDIPTKPAQLPRRIAAKLPSAEAVNQTVAAEVAIPGQNGGGSTGTNLAAIGYVTVGAAQSANVQVTCPSGKDPKIVAGINSLNIMGNHGAGNWPIGHLTVTAKQASYDQKTNTATYTISIAADSRLTHGISILNGGQQVMYVGACVPKPPPAANKHVVL